MTEMTSTSANWSPSDAERRSGTHPYDRAVLRGLLIILIALGHSKYFQGNFYFLYIVLYSFHIGAFFLIIGDLPIPKRSFLDELLRNLRRFFVPFAVFAIIYAILFYFVILRPAGMDPLIWGRDLARALVMATPPDLRQAAGFEMLWFLPTFIVFLSMRHALSYAGVLRIPLLLGLAVVHITVGLMTPEWQRVMPFGATIALYLYFPMVIYERWGDALRGVDWRLLTGIFLVASIVQVVAWYPMILADYQLGSIASPFHLLTNDIQLIAGTVLAMQASRVIVRLRWLTWVRSFGVVSLQIYLVHGIISLTLYMMSRKVFPNGPIALLLPANLVLTLGASYFVVFFAQRLPGFVWLFSVPRSRRL